MSNRVKHILVLLPNPLGDAVLCTPALRRLREHFPEAHITLLGKKSVCDCLRGTRLADELMDYGSHRLSGFGLFKTAKWLRNFGFDSVILLTNSFRSALLVKLAKISRRIGYDRDGRGWLLSEKVSPFRWGKRFMPISMLDYYGFLMDRAIAFMGQQLREPFVQANRQMALDTTDQDRQAVASYLQKQRINADDKLIVLVPGGAFGGSKWWPAERFAALADRFSGEGFMVCLLCAPNDVEREIAGRVIEAAQKPLHNLLDSSLGISAIRELIRRSALMVANDTGPCHIAAALEAPLVTLFGPNDPRWTATGYEKEIRLRVDVDCGPCQKPVCVTDHRCLERIGVDEVYGAAKELLDNNTNRPGASRNPAVLKKQPYRVFEESFVPLADGSGLIHKDYLDLLSQNKLATLTEVFAYEQGEKLVKPGLGSRQRLRVELVDEQQEPIVFFVKRYGAPRRQWFFEKLLATAVYDFKAAMELAEKGIDVARPIAYGVERQGKKEKRSFVIFEQLPDADALERLLPNRQQNEQKYPLLKKHKRLIREIAALVGKFHGAGYFHRDLYLSHIFLGNNLEGSDRLSLIDLQRVFRPKLLQQRWRVKDLAQLYYSSRAFFSKVDMMRFMHDYLNCRRLNAEQKTLIRHVYAKTQRIARHDAKRQARIAKSSS